jgi:hypothetical protein
MMGEYCDLIYNGTDAIFRTLHGASDRQIASVARGQYGTGHCSRGRYPVDTHGAVPVRHFHFS